MTTAPSTTMTIATADDAAAAETKLAAIRARLDGMDAEHRRIQDDLGRVLAASAMGDKRAPADAGRLALQRSGIEADRRDLGLTRDALATALAVWQGDQRGRTVTAATAAAQQAAAAGQRLEAQLVTEWRALMTTAQALRDCRTRFQAAKTTVGQAGGEEAAADVADLVAPRDPVDLVGGRGEVWADPERAIQLWRGEPVPPLRLIPADERVPAPALDAQRPVPSAAELSPAFVFERGR